MMKPTGATLKVIYDNKLITIDVNLSGKTEVYLVHLPGNLPLFITKTRDGDNHEFWTSVPQGRLEEATAIGLLIDQEKQKKPNTLF